VPLADVEFELAEGIVVAHVEGEIDLSNGEELRNALASRLTNEALGLVLDLREVAYLDSAGIHLIYALRERLGNRGQQLRLVVGAGSPITEVLRITDVPRTVGAFETVDAAVQSITT
jgi:anti-anti-sigma factor